MASNYFHKEQRASSLESFAPEILELVARRGSSGAWAEWLQVPLNDAASEGNIDLVNALIGAGASMGSGLSGSRFPLESAVLSKNVDVVSALVAAGSPLESRHCSALHTAIYFGHGEAARRLIKAGASLHYLDPLQGWDALFWAVERGREELVTDLLEAGATPNTTTNGSGRTPLHVAAKYGSTAMVSALLARGADKDARDRYGKTPLMDAVEHCNASDRFFSAQTFQLDNIQPPAQQNHLVVVNMLLTAGADVNIRECNDGTTVLVTAAQHGYMDILHAILRHGADLDAVDEWDRCSVLHMAAKNGGPAGAIHALVESGADIKLKNSDGLTPLECATKHNNGEAMRALLQYGAEGEAQATSMLRLACEEQYGGGLDTTVDILLRFGANDMAVDGNGRTPLDLLDLDPVDLDSSYDFDEEEVERARLLLIGARTWRRRGWVVMLYSRASKARTASRDTGDSHEHSTDAAGGSEDVGCSKITKVEHASRGTIGLLGQVGDGRVAGGGSEGGGFGAVVESLIGLELEDVFRTVVGFL